MNEREYQIGFCKACQKSSFDSNKGVICKLTNNIADFEYECDNFEGDKDKIPFIITRNEYENVSTEQDDPVEGYPPKPYEDEQKQSIIKSLTSLVFFVAAFYLIFRWEFKYIAILALVLFIHEIGHLIAMKVFKYKDVNIFFIPLIGAAATGKKENISQKQKAIIALAGPFPGLIIGSLCYIYGQNLNNELLIKTSDIFIYLNLFNLLPILPLDGGQVIKSLFFNSNEKVNIIFLWISIALLTIIALKLESYFLLIVPLFIFFRIKNQTELSSIREILKSKNIETDKSFEELSNEEYWLIRDELALNKKNLSSMIEPKNYRMVENETIVIRTIKSLLKKQPIGDLKLGGKIIFILIWFLAFLTPFVIIGIHYIVNR